MKLDRTSMTSGLVVLTLIAASGCVIRTSARPPRARATVRVNAGAPPPPPPAQATVTVTANQPTTATGVTVIETSCVQGAQEQCNGLDDNCNGQIDEGCGYSSGNIQITLGWNTQADLDMYVMDPAGETISYQHKRSASGGHLDQDARGACNPNQANNAIENVYWDQANPPSGVYRVQVKYWDGSSCSTNAGPTQLTLSIAVGGRIVGAYNYMINPSQSVDIASFQI